MAKAFKKTLGAVFALILLFFSLFSVCGNAFGAPASAASYVMEDLQRDECFNLDDYPEVLDDYSLKVIQIAESSDGELLIYVYQPSGQGTGIYASSINIARDKNNTVDLKYVNYKLEYLNSSGVFYKYKVKNFELEESDIRYYNISNILRPFQYLYDDVPENGNKITEVENRVGQVWTAFTINGVVSYEMTGSDVVEITQKYVGYVNINGGWKQGAWYTYTKYTFKNFVAFSTNYNIDRLIQADIQYSLADISFGVCHNGACPYHTKGATFNERKGEPVPQDVKTLYADKQSQNIDFGWGGHKFTWYDIQSTEDFLADNNNANYKLTTEGANDLSGTQWVLNFHNAEFSSKSDHSIWDLHAYHNGQTVSDVMILRLMFETDGVTYNLGVVDNVQTGDGVADNYQIPKSWISMFLDTCFGWIPKVFNGVAGWIANLFHIPDWLGKVFAVVAIIIVVIIVVVVVVSICRLIPQKMGVARSEPKPKPRPGKSKPAKTKARKPRARNKRK